MDQLHEAAVFHGARGVAHDQLLPVPERDKKEDAFGPCLRRTGGCQNQHL